MNRSTKFKLALAVIIPILLICICCLVMTFLTLVIGSEKNIVEEREFTEFNEITVENSIDIKIVKSNRYFVTVEGEDNIVPLIETKVENNKLIVQNKRRFLFFTPRFLNRKDIKITLETPDFDAVSFIGNGKIESLDTFDFNELKIEMKGNGKLDLRINANKVTTTINGNGDIKLSGKANDQDLKILGSGNYFAKDLQTTNTQIDIIGSGNTTVNVSGKLDIDISGSGKVSYVGDPDITQDVAGSGKIEKL